jgi:hypothetical protein
MLLAQKLDWKGLSKSIRALQMNNILLSKGVYSSYEFCKNSVFSASPLYLRLLLLFICHKVRRFFLKVAMSKLPNIYLYSPVDMKLY